jgi:osmoprotectant transport system ATP-binding protein
MIELECVSKRYGATLAVDDVSLSIAKGEFCVVIGTSGAGKSTVLKMINRLIPHSSGAIRVDGADIGGLPVEQLRRRMGYVIQSIGLFPHWTVARALAADPDLLLMDEPFGALDPITRQTLQAEIAEIHRASRKTIVFVTHDMDEALRLATRIAVMDRGKLVQTATPVELLTAPANGFVRDLVGRDDLGIKLLAIETVANRARRGDAAPGEPIAATASLRHALSRMVAERQDRLAVVDADGRPAGAVHLADLLRR